MEQQNRKKLIWFSILTIFIGTIASFLLYFFGWVASITSFITMYVFILLYKKFCQKLPDKKVLTYAIFAVNISHIIAIVLGMFITTAIANQISVADAFALISEELLSYIIMLVITIGLTIAMSLFGSLSAYQYHKNLFKTKELSFESQKQAGQEQTNKLQENNVNTVE